MSVRFFSRKPEKSGSQKKVRKVPKFCENVVFHIFSKSGHWIVLNFSKFIQQNVLHLLDKIAYLGSCNILKKALSQSDCTIFQFLIFHEPLRDVPAYGTVEHMTRHTTGKKSIF